MRSADRRVMPGGRAASGFIDTANCMEVGCWECVCDLSQGGGAGPTACMRHARYGAKLVMKLNLLSMHLLCCSDARQVAASCIPKAEQQHTGL